MYESFRMQLITSLSMDDVIFLVLLREENLLPGNLNDQVQLAEKTSAQKAALFLDKVVESSIDIGEFEPLNKLLTIMSDDVYLKNDSLKQLANKIKEKLDKESSLIPMNRTGQCILNKHMCMFRYMLINIYN